MLYLRPRSDPKSEVEGVLPGSLCNVFGDVSRRFVFVNRNWPTFDHPIWHTPLW